MGQDLPNPHPRRLLLKVQGEAATQYLQDSCILSDFLRQKKQSPVSEARIQNLQPDSHRDSSPWNAKYSNCQPSFTENQPGGNDQQEFSHPYDDQVSQNDKQEATTEEEGVSDG